jgi:hypothetical protein
MDTETLLRRRWPGFAELPPSGSGVRAVYTGDSDPEMRDSPVVQVKTVNVVQSVEITGTDNLIGAVPTLTTNGRRANSEAFSMLQATMQLYKQHKCMALGGTDAAHTRWALEQLFVHAIHTAREPQRAAFARVIARPDGGSGIVNAVMTTTNASALNLGTCIGRVPRSTRLARFPGVHMAEGSSAGAVVLWSHKTTYPGSKSLGQTLATARSNHAAVMKQGAVPPGVDLARWRQVLTLIEHVGKLRRTGVVPAAATKTAEHRALAAEARRLVADGGDQAARRRVVRRVIRRLLAPSIDMPVQVALQIAGRDTNEAPSLERKRTRHVAIAYAAPRTAGSTTLQTMRHSWHVLSHLKNRHGETDVAAAHASTTRSARVAVKRNGEACYECNHRRYSLRTGRI